MQWVRSDTQAAQGFRRILKNLGWLLGGKGFAAICSIAYLAILARSLGLKDFGHFSLIFGTAQALVALSSFQTWQTIVRFGAHHLADQNWCRFGRLVMFGGAIDLIGAVLGCAIAGLAIYGFADTFELNPDYVDTAFAFICVFVFARITTPLGMLRVLDRFDLAVTAGALIPAGRLLAAIFIWQSGATVERFLFAWAVIELSTTMLYCFLAWRLRPETMRAADVLAFRETISENSGIMHFLGITYANSSAKAALQQGPLLAVGYFLGTSSAGVYRVADQLAKGMSKLSNILAQALYPEVNRARHTTSASEFWKLIRGVNVMVVITGVIVTGLAILVGEPFITFIAGEEFARGAVVLIPLAIAASFELASVAYDPVLHSAGRPAWTLIARLVSVLTLALAIAALVGFGGIGIGWAVAIAFLIGYLVLSATVWVVLNKDFKKA